MGLTVTVIAAVPASCAVAYGISCDQRLPFCVTGPTGAGGAGGQPTTSVGIGGGFVVSSSSGGGSDASDGCADGSCGDSGDRTDGGDRG
jgi:hypothetical protein